MVRLCMCACVCVCWCVSSEWIGEQEMCVDMRVIENERKRLSRGFFFSLSPSLLPEGQSLNPNVSQNKSIVFFWRLRHRATCRLLCNQTFKNSSEQQFFKLQIMPESTRFRDPFKLQLSDWNLKFYCAAMKYFCPQISKFLERPPLSLMKLGCLFPGYGQFHRSRPLHCSLLLLQQKNKYR